MANKYEGTQTEKNLQVAFAGESQARNKYTYFASAAKKEGYEQMSALFLKTADNEKEHAKMWFKELAGIGDTKANLEAAADGENYEWTQMYKEYAETARQEKLDNIADLFELVGAIEKDHESRFNTFAQMLSDGSIRSSSGETVWLCRNCGHIHCGSTPPEYCPVCRRPQGYFQRKEDSRLS